jgi:membrane protein insertase Oxa1/YidC/SpoIIIJ
VLGVLFGSVIGNAIMYAFSKQINQYVGRENYWLKIAGIVLIIGLVVLMELRYRHVKNKYLNSEQGTEGLDKTEEEE